MRALRVSGRVREKLVSQSRQILPVVVSIKELNSIPMHLLLAIVHQPKNFFLPFPSRNCSITNWAASFLWISSKAMASCETIWLRPILQRVRHVQATLNAFSCGPMFKEPIENSSDSVRPRNVPSCDHSSLLSLSVTRRSSRSLNVSWNKVEKTALKWNTKLSNYACAA